MNLYGCGGGCSGIQPSAMGDIGVVGEQPWHVPFVMGALAAAGVMYFWPQKRAFFGEVQDEPKLKCVKWGYKVVRGRRRRVCKQFAFVD